MFCTILYLSAKRIDVATKAFARSFTACADGLR
jgi:hypothetical protein